MAEIIYRMQRKGLVPSLPEVTGMAKSSIYLAIKQGSFPLGIKLGPRTRGWTDSQIIKWLESRGVA